MAVKSASTSRSTKTPARPRQPADEPRQERRPGARPMWTGNLRLALVAEPDPWAEFFDVSQSLSAAALRALGVNGKA